MTRTARPWLPKAALFDSTLADAVADRARAWARHWFVDERRVEVRLCPGAAFPGAPDGARAWVSDDVSLLLDPRAPLAFWMLDLTPGAHKANAADTKLLERLAASAARDLFERVRGLFGLEPPADAPQARRPAGEDLVFSFGLGAATNLLHLVVAPGRAIGARKALLPTAPAPPRVHAIQNALAGQTIRVGAMVGLARLPLADIRSLSVGDVVVLDRGQDEALDLAIEGARVEGASCEIGGDDANLTLRLRHSGKQANQGHPA